MEAEKILSADVLDIIFENRNKEYGAYQIRKGYNRDLLIAIACTLAALLLFAGGYYISQMGGGKAAGPMSVNDVHLESLSEEKKIEPPPPPPVHTDPPKVEIVKFTPPKIVKDEEVKPEEKPPLQDSLEDTHIGTVNQEGIKDDGLVGPVEPGKGLVDAPRSPGTDYDQTFTKVEIESSYPGGMPAWQRYLERNFHYPDEAAANDIKGRVVVQFIVDKEGNLSEVQAISGPEEGGLREEAVRVIKKSGRWEPAVQNGRKVKSFKKQPIVFAMDPQ